MVIGSVNLRGPDPGSEFIEKPTNPPTTSPFGNDLLSQIKSHPEQYGSVLELGLCTLRQEIMKWS